MSDAAPRKSLLRDIFISVVLGAGVVGLAVAVAGPFIVDWIRAGVQEQGIDGFWLPIGRVAVVIVLALALVTIVVFVAVSIVSRTWRERIWRRPFGWLWGLRVITEASRDKSRVATEHKGYLRRSVEVDAERRIAQQPAWRVDATDRLFGDMGLHWLTNSGYAAKDVAITADPSEFKIDGEAFFVGSFGDAMPGGSTGKQFRGAPTEKGREHGVTFVVTWRDGNDDPQDREVYMSPEDIRHGRDSAMEEARALGWEEGYAEAKKVHEEAAAAAAASNVPAPWPRWAIQTHAGNFTEGVAGRFAASLSNKVPGSTALGVRIDGVAGGEVLDAGHWDDLSGVTTGRFDVSLDRAGLHEGSTFKVEWTDESGTRQQGAVKAPPAVPF